jgi:hypothetical protein
MKTIALEIRENFQTVSMSWVWWYMPAIPALGRLKPEAP